MISRVQQARVVLNSGGGRRWHRWLGRPVAAGLLTGMVAQGLNQPTGMNQHRILGHAPAAHGQLGMCLREDPRGGWHISDVLAGGCAGIAGGQSPYVMPPLVLCSIGGNILDAFARG